MKTNLNEVNKAFKLEKLRHKYAIQHKLNELKMTYTTGHSQIVNSNSSSMWDNLNKLSNYTVKLNPMAVDRIKTAVKFIKINTDTIKILDIGFGPADFEKRLKIKFKNKLEVYGIDISKNSVNKARKLFPQWEFANDSISKHKFKQNEIYNYVIMLEVLEHISPIDTINVLRKIYKLLKPEGHLVLSVPLNEGLEKMVKSGFNPNAHVRVYTKELIETELEMAGFRITKRRLFYAFHKNYWIKSVITKLLDLDKKPNNIVVLAQKT